MYNPIVCAIVFMEVLFHGRSIKDSAQNPQDEPDQA